MEITVSGRAEHGTQKALLDIGQSKPNIGLHMVQVTENECEVGKQ